MCSYGAAIRELRGAWPNAGWCEDEEGGSSGDEYVIAGEIAGVSVELWSEGDEWLASAVRGVGIASRSDARPTPTEAVQRALYLAR